MKKEFSNFEFRMPESFDILKRSQKKPNPENTKELQQYHSDLRKQIKELIKVEPENEELQKYLAELKNTVNQLKK